jgi:hypothetical protein
MVATTLHPAHEADFLANVGGTEIAAEMAFFPITQNVDQVHLLGHAKSNTRKARHMRVAILKKANCKL